MPDASASTQTELESLGIVEREHTSFSQLSTYNSCGQKFYLQKIAHVPQAPAGALIGGRVVHAVIEESERQQWWRDPLNFAVGPYDPNEELPPDPPALMLFRDELHKRVEQAGGVDVVQWGGRDSGEDLTWWEHQGEFMLRRYQATREAMDADGWGATEDRTEYRVETTVPGLSLPILAYLDKFLMHEMGEPLIVDWKTGRIGNAEPTQFATYAAVILATRGIRVERGAAVFLRAADAARRVKHMRFEGLIDRVGEMYHDAEKGIEAGLFPPKPSWLCGSCGVRSACWYWQATNEGD